MSILGILLTIPILFLAFSANAGLSSEAERVQKSYAKLVSSPNDPATQLAYLEAFPQTHDEFMTVFMPPDFKQLYDGHEYVYALRDIGTAFPEKTIELLLRIVATARWNADAVNYLQNVTLGIAFSNPQLFVRCLIALAKREQDGVVRFLADGIEGPKPSFLELADRIEEVGQALLAKRMREEAQISKERADHEHGR